MATIIRLVLFALVAVFGSQFASANQTCPLSYGSTDSAKSHKFYLYFPTTDDASYPYDGPARHFDVAELSTGIGTTAQLRDRVFDIVADDFCEFNVQVIQTTTSPDSLASPPPRRHIQAIGSDASGGTAWGQSPIANADIVRGRVWAGRYVVCEGSDQMGGCSSSGALTGTNNTLDRWAQAIGGTAAHEGGHTYGLVHNDDDPPISGFGSACGEYGLGPATGEDDLTRHLMPNGCRLNGNVRASYRRHVSDRGFGILATNVGLSVQTMHNWDFVNPNGVAARSLAMEFLSAISPATVTWSYTGPTSPWMSPTVAAIGTGTWHGATLNRYRITWSTPNPAWGGASGTVAAGGQFHIGATFTGVDFNVPDPIVIQNITLFDASSNALTLHPRLPMYDAGTPDALDGTFAVHFENAGAALLLEQATIYQLPRLAAIESMVRSGRPRTFDGLPIRPWAAIKCRPQQIRERVRCLIANVKDRPHILVERKLGQPGVVDCSRGLPPEILRGGSQINVRDWQKAPDNDGPICAARVRDPFPSATVYIIATFVDPRAKHWNPRTKRYVIGPVRSKLYYQFAGIRDLQRRKEGRLAANFRY